MYYLAKAGTRPLPQPLPLVGRLAFVGIFALAAIFTATVAANSLRTGVFRGRRGKSCARQENLGFFWFNVVFAFVWAAFFMVLAAYFSFAEMRIH